MVNNDKFLQKGLSYIDNPKLRELAEREEPLQLCFWPESKRAAPNEIVRSALFNIRNHRIKRQFYKDVPVVVIGDGEITYRGEELRQDDLDVWLQLLHLARNQPINDNDLEKDLPTVKFTPKGFCKAIGWPITGYYYNKLEDVLGRLGATELTVKSRRLNRTIALSIIRKREIRINGAQSNRLAEWSVWLEPEIVLLFGDKYFSSIDWEIRKKLSGLGKWLQMYYQSHAIPHDLKIETVKSACGSSHTRIRDFKVLLEKGLKELEQHNIVEKAEITDANKVRVIRHKKIKNQLVN